MIPIHIQISIAPPTGMVSIDTVSALLGVRDRFMNVDPLMAIGVTFKHAKGSLHGATLQSLVQSAMLETEPYPVTHVFFVDHLMTFPPEAMYRLLEHDVPIIGCNYAVMEEL
ncbi:MAG: hypothetical protein OK436_06655, partial [Thaumarchaeota archaeon]|nr:hypothetical protein [Nitrososphaerota archaeon]